MFRVQYQEGKRLGTSTQRQQLRRLRHSTGRPFAVGRVLDKHIKKLSRGQSGYDSDNEVELKYGDDLAFIKEDDLDENFEDIKDIEGKAFGYNNVAIQKLQDQQSTQSSQLNDVGLSENVAHPIERPGVPDGTDPNNPVRMYADGVFDMYHIGHAKLLEQVKKMFPYTTLVVGVSGDHDTVMNKGKIVMNEKERSDILMHCKWVDEVICPCPWVINMPFLLEHNIHYVAHDDIPYDMGANPGGDIYYEVKKAGMFKATQRTDGISTSDIILRIIKDYDMYIWRSMKRGYTSKDLNISLFKAQQIKLRESYIGLKSKLKQKPFTKTLDDGYDDLRKILLKFAAEFEQKSEVIKQKFVRKYMNNSRRNEVMNKLFNKKTTSQKRRDEVDGEAEEKDNDRVLANGTVQIKEGEQTWELNPEANLVVN